MKLPKNLCTGLLMTAYLYTTEASKSVDNSKVIILPFAKSSDEEKCSGM